MVKRSNKLIFCILIFLASIQYIEFWKLSLWIDEFGTYKFASGLQNLEKETHTGFYYFLVSLSLKIFGTNLFSMRFPNLVFSVTLLITSIIFVRNKKYMVSSQILFVCINFHPTAWVFLRESRVYIFLYLFSWIVIILTESYLKSNKTKYLYWMLFVNFISSLFAVVTLVYLWSITFILIWIRKWDFKIRKTFYLSFLASTPILIFYFFFKDMDNLKFQVSWVPSLDSSWFMEFPRILLGKKWTQFLVEQPFLVEGVVLFTFTTSIYSLIRHKGKHDLLSIKMWGSVIVIFHLLMIFLYPYLNLFISKFFIALVPVVTYTYFLIMKPILSSLKSVVLVATVFLFYNVFVLDIFNEKNYQLPLINYIEENKKDHLLLLCDTWKMGNAIRDLYFSEYNVIACDDSNASEKIKQSDKVMIFVAASYLDDKDKIRNMIKKNFILIKRKTYYLQFSYLEFYRKRYANEL